MSWVAVSALLLGAIAAGPFAPAVEGFTAARPGCEGKRLTVVVEEGAEQVRLRVRVGMRIDPGSVEVDLDGRRISVSAREPDGERVCSGDLWVREPAVEEGSLADYEDGWLTITLAKEQAR
jgi:HSP20 family molecular chaperone IbpA